MSVDMDMDLSTTPPSVAHASANGIHTLHQAQHHNTHHDIQHDIHQPGSLPSSPDRRPKKSSSTCTTCRARKVRCNGSRPLCASCQRLGFPCSYDDADPGAWTVALPRRRVKQACLSCHGRKARCSGHMPVCDRCRAQGLECVYRPSKRARLSIAGRVDHSPGSVEGDFDDMHNDSDPGLTDPASTATPSTYNHDVHYTDQSFDAVISRTFEKFFLHVHHIPNYSFLHRASLMEQYHAGKVDKALLFALIGITSCLTDMGPGMREYGERCISDAEALIFADYTRPSTIKVQALVFIIKHRILSNKFPNAFVLLSIAARFAAALRLNYDAPGLCFLAQESRRRLMWALYCIDSGISGGYRDFSLWRTDRINIGLPCNERNFEFDLPQTTEKLVPGPNDPHPPQGEDIGSLALYIRIQHIRHKIVEFTKGVVLGRESLNAVELQTHVIRLHKELDDFAAHLPTSFQFSDSSLRLRAYSPRLCVFIMIHVWWRQCHCDLYRLALGGLREALPKSTISSLDESFLEHCQRQCVDHSLAMVSIFSAMQKLNARPVADLDLAICAYQCARMLMYAHQTDAVKFNLPQEAVTEKSNFCLQAIKQYCMGSAAQGIRMDLEKLIAHGLSPRTTPSRVGSPDNRSQKSSDSNNLARHSMFRNMAVGDDISNRTRPTSAAAAALSQDSLPPSLISTPWPGNRMSPAIPVPVSGAPATRNKHDIPDMDEPPEFTPTELNNAYEGALDGLGLDNGLDYAMGIDVNMWVPNGDWMGSDFLNGGIGA